MLSKLKYLFKPLTSFLSGVGEGNAAIEFAMLLPVLALCMFGIVEVTSMITTKERMNRVSNQMVAALSALPTWDQNGEIDPILTASEVISGGQGFSVEAVFCGTVTGQKASYQKTFTRGQCGIGPLDKGRVTARATCNSIDPSVARGQYVVVQVTCNYNPVFNFSWFFSNRRKAINTLSFAPMRNPMNW